MVTHPDFQARWGEGFTALSQVAEAKEQAARARLTQSLVVAERSQRESIAIMSLGVLVALLVGWLIARSIRGATERIRASVEKLAAGQLDERVPYTDYPNEIGDLARAVAVLQGEARTLEERRWIKTHQAAISSELQAATSLEALGRTFLARMAPLLGMVQGVIYRYEEEAPRLRLLAAYAHPAPGEPSQYFDLGQGLVGQCAWSARPSSSPNRRRTTRAWAPAWARPRRAPSPSCRCCATIACWRCWSWPPSRAWPARSRRCWTS